MFLKYFTLLLIILSVLYYLHLRRAYRKRIEQENIQDIPTPSHWYHKRYELYTSSERRVFKTLELASVPLNLKVQGKIPLTELIFVRPELTQEDFELSFQKIKDILLDFVLLDGETLQPLLVITLLFQPENSELLRELKLHNAFIEEALNQASLPLLYLYEADKYSIEHLRAAIEQKIGRNTTILNPPSTH